MAPREGNLEIGSCSELSTRALLRLYADILTELLHRGIVRSRNAPAGDLAEEIVRLAYDGSLAPPSEKSWDVLTADGRRLQVKCRVVDPALGKAQTFSPFRSWGFDACVFVILDVSTYDLLHARVVDTKDLQLFAQPTAWVNGFRVTWCPGARSPGYRGSVRTAPRCLRPPARRRGVALNGAERLGCQDQVVRE